MRERYAYNMREFGEKVASRARYEKRRDSQCREKKARGVRKDNYRFRRDCEWQRQNRLRSARKQREIIEDKWREYIEMPINASI